MTDNTLPDHPIRAAALAALDARREEMIDALGNAERVPRELPDEVDPIGRALLMDRCNAQLVDRLVLPGEIIRDAAGVPVAIGDPREYLVGELVEAVGVRWHFIEYENGDTLIVEEPVE